MPVHGARWYALSEVPRRVPGSSVLYAHHLALRLAAVRNAVRVRAEVAIALGLNGKDVELVRLAPREGRLQVLEGLDRLRAPDR